MARVFKSSYKPEEAIQKFYGALVYYAMSCYRADEASQIRILREMKKFPELVSEYLNVQLMIQRRLDVGAGLFVALNLGWLTFDNLSIILLY